MKAARSPTSCWSPSGATGHNFIRVNFPNGDMVGHTGHAAGGRDLRGSHRPVRGPADGGRAKAGAVLVLTADHGNADEMLEVGQEDRQGGDRQAQGPAQVQDQPHAEPGALLLLRPAGASNVRISSAALQAGLGISSLAATCLNLLGYEAPEDYDPSLVDAG
jgi:2,3-bisphosphoglycerate-independent phosphoglycerate mutase